MFEPPLKPPNPVPELRNNADELLALLLFVKGDTGETHSVPSFWPGFWQTQPHTIQWFKDLLGPLIRQPVQDIFAGVSEEMLSQLTEVNLKTDTPLGLLKMTTLLKVVLWWTTHSSEDSFRDTVLEELDVIHRDFNVAKEEIGNTPDNE